jgi:hypothetical protein
MSGPWRSASEQIDLPVEAETRRLSEWPVGPSPGSTRRFELDPVGVTVTPKGSGYDVKANPALRSELPTRRFNVLLCGAAAAIVDSMLTWGSRSVEGCIPKYEPLLLLCVRPFPPDPSEIASGVDTAMLILRDSTIDAIVWYDIEHHGILQELRRLDTARDPRKTRGWFRRSQTVSSGARVPMLVLTPFSEWNHAAKEFAAVQAGKLLVESRDLYRALRDMIATGQDDDQNGLL